jgi:hypothetical protein
METFELPSALGVHSDQSKIECPKCHGRGMEKCSRCNGPGKLKTHRVPCDACNGSGGDVSPLFRSVARLYPARVVHRDLRRCSDAPSPCKKCDGTGVICDNCTNCEECATTGEILLSTAIATFASEEYVSEKLVKAILACSEYSSDPKVRSRGSGLVKLFDAFSEQLTSAGPARLEEFPSLGEWSRQVDLVRKQFG